LKKKTQWKKAPRKKRRNADSSKRGLHSLYLATKKAAVYKHLRYYTVER
jgi:hypothetical protein